MKEALKLALEALTIARGQLKSWGLGDEAITAIKKALAQDSKRPIESDYISQVAYTRALEAYCDGLAQHERVRDLECVIADLKAECRALWAEQPAPVIQKSCEQCAHQYHYEEMTSPCRQCRFYSNFALAPQPAPVQPEQEPVACVIDGDLYFHHEIDWEDLAYQGHGVELLYTIPPQRLPLTDEKISLIAHNIDLGDWNDLNFKECWHEGFQAGFREAEIEHNIKGTP